MIGDTPEQINFEFAVYKIYIARGAEAVLYSSQHP